MQAERPFKYVTLGAIKEIDIERLPDSITVQFECKQTQSNARLVRCL